VREYLKLFGLARELQHTQRPTDVAVHGLIDACVEVDARCAVDDNMTILNNVI
jgi:hypothetical protein